MPFVLADSWHLYNDRAVSGASKDTVISYEAYLLFYQKVAAEVRMRGSYRGKIGDHIGVKLCPQSTG